MFITWSFKNAYGNKSYRSNEFLAFGIMAFLNEFLKYFGTSLDFEHNLEVWNWLNNGPNALVLTYLVSPIQCLKKYLLLNNLILLGFFYG